MTEKTGGGSFWKWIGFGCGGCLLIVVALIIAGVWFGKSTLSSMTEGMNDPAVLAVQTSEVFGFDTLPETYDPSFHIDIPFTFRSAILADLPFDQDRGFDGEPDRILGMVWLRWMMTRDSDLDPLLAETPDWVTFTKKLGVRLQEEDRIDVGGFDIGDARVDYESWAGEYRSGAFNLDLDGGLMLWRVTCPGNDQALGMWFRRVEETPWEEALRGDALRNLFAGSDLCLAVR